MEIINFIPQGKKNAVSRYELSHFTGWSDRKVRHEIHKAREDHVILSLDNGKGYYIPTVEDFLELRKYILREMSRAKSIFVALRTAIALYEDYKRGRLNV